MPRKKALFKLKNKKESQKVIVVYEGKDWQLEDLLKYISDKMYLLEKQKCKPSVKCLFEGREYMDQKHDLGPSPVEFIYWG